MRAWHLRVAHSAVPSGLFSIVGAGPKVETLGWCQSSLRDETLNVRNQCLPATLFPSTRRREAGAPKMSFYVRKRRQPPAVIIVALVDVLIVLLIFLVATTVFK